jgi:hypothetical protein
MSTPRSLVLVCWILAVSMLAGTAAPAAVFAQSAQQSAPFGTPEGQDLTRIQERFASGRPARIFAQGRTQIVNSPRITPEGVAWLAPSATGQGTVPSSPMLHWTEIERLQARGNAAGIGAATGAVIVGGFGLALGLSLGSSDFLTSTKERGGVAVSAAIVGGIAGAGVGALVGAVIPKWVNVRVGHRAR